MNRVEFMGYPVVASRDTMMDYGIHNEIDEVFIAYTDGLEQSVLKAGFPSWNRWALL